MKWISVGLCQPKRASFALSVHLNTKSKSKLKTFTAYYDKLYCRVIQLPFNIFLPSVLYNNKHIASSYNREALAPICHISLHRDESAYTDNHIINDYSISASIVAYYCVSITTLLSLYCSKCSSAANASQRNAQSKKHTAHVIDMCLTSFIMLFWCRCAFYRIVFLHFFFFSALAARFDHRCYCFVCSRHLCVLCVINRMQYAIIWNAVIIWRKAIVFFCSLLHFALIVTRQSTDMIFYKYVIAVKLVIHDLKFLFSHKTSHMKDLNFCIARASISDCFFFLCISQLNSSCRLLLPSGWWCCCKQKSCAPHSNAIAKAKCSWQKPIWYQVKDKWR